MSTKRARLQEWLARFDLYLLLVALFSLFPIGPLLQPGYQWDAHDARHSVYFLLEFDRGIQDGVLYPRWQPDFAFGYGYPFFNIYGPLSSYAGEAFHLLGLSFSGSVKAVFALSILLSGLAMYGFVKRVAGRQAALVAAVAYMAMPYRLVDVFVRAALAESTAYVFVPLVLWGTWSTLHRPRLVNLLGLAFSYAALLYTHPVMGLLLSLILVAYIASLALARLNDLQPWRHLTRESALPLLGHLGHLLLPTASGLLLGLGLSAHFLVPAMTENRFVRVDQWYGGRYAWGSDFVEFFQLFSPRWGFGTSIPGPNDQLSFQLGIVPVVLGLFALTYLFRREGSAHLSRRVRRLTMFFAVLTAVAIFLMLDLSAPLWQVLPLVQLTQFPWRLLSIVVVSLAFLCGMTASQTQESEASISLPALALAILLLLGSLPYMQAEISQQETSLAGLMRFQQSADEMTGSTAWVRQIPDWSPLADYFVAGEPLTSKVDYTFLYQQAGEAHARTVKLGAQYELVEYYADRPVLLSFNTFYYPGWRAYLLDFETGALVDELPIALRGELGLMTVRLPTGLGQVLLRFEATPIRRLASTVTLVSLVLAALLPAAGALLRRQGRRVR